MRGSRLEDSFGETDTRSGQNLNQPSQYELIPKRSLGKCKKSSLKDQKCKNN
jgi:hypothetical protein